MLCKAVAGPGGAAHGTDPACASPKPSWKGEILCFTPGGCSLGWQWPRVVTPPAWFGLPGGSLGLGNLGWVPCTPRPRVPALLPAPGPAAWGGGCAGPHHAGRSGCGVTQRCRMSVGSRPSSQMLARARAGAEETCARLAPRTLRRQERPRCAAPPPPPAPSVKFVAPFPLSARPLSTFSSLPLSHPLLLPRGEASTRFPALGRGSCALASSGRGTAACARGSLGAKSQHRGWEPGKGWMAWLQEGLAPSLPPRPALLSQPHNGTQSHGPQPCC